MNNFRSPKSTVVEMSQNHHQVSIIGCGSSFSQDHPVVSRSFSSASNQWKERSSPEGRSCGDLEQEQKEEEEVADQVNHCVSVHTVVVGGGGVVRAEHFISFRVHGRNLTELAMAGRIL